MHKGKLLCPADREAAQGTEQRASKESEEVRHQAWVQRIKTAATTAAGTLKAGGRPTLSLAMVEGKARTKSNAYGDQYRRKGWWELKERVGRGWILFTATHTQLEGATTRATVVLGEDDRLLWADTEDEVELGPKRVLGGPRETALRIDEELDPDERMVWGSAREVGLKELEAQLAKQLS